MAHRCDVELVGPGAQGSPAGPCADTDSRWRLTYRFSTSPSPLAEHTHALYLSLAVPSFPRTEEERRQLVRETSPFLVRQWRAMDLPLGDLYHHVDRPGAVLDRPPDDACGLVWVSVVLANTPVDGRLVVARVPVSGDGASPRTNGRTTRHSS